MVECVCVYVCVCVHACVHTCAKPSNLFTYNRLNSKRNMGILILYVLSISVFKKKCCTVVAHTFNPSTWEIEAGGSL